MEKPTRYFYAFKYQRAIITEGEEEAYLVKVGISGAGEDFLQVLRRLYDHNNSAEHRLKITLNIPLLTSKDNPISPTKGKTIRSSPISVEVTSLASLLSYMALDKHGVAESRAIANAAYQRESDAKIASSPPFVDLMFILPFYSDVAFLPTAEALVRLYLGGAIFVDFETAWLKAVRKVDPHIDEDSSKKFNYTEMIVCSRNLFDDVRTLWRSKAIETVEKLIERADSKNFQLNFAYQSVTMEWKTDSGHNLKINFKAGHWQRSKLEFKH